MLTFKNQPRAAGLAAVGAGTPSIDIRLDGEAIGVINFNDSMSFANWYPELANKITIQFIVPASKAQLEKNPNCPWMWVKIKQRFTDGDHAKAWVRENSDLIIRNAYLISKGEKATA
jgi:hypothetical protein